MKKRIISILSVVLILSVLLMGCGSGSKSTTPNDEGSSDNSGAKYKVGVLMSQNADTFIQKITDGIKAQAEKYPEIELLINDAEGETEKQISQCETLVAQKVDAIIANVVDAEGSNPIVEMCNEAGIPLVLCNRLTTNENYDVYTGSNDVEAAKIQSEFVKKVLPAGSKVCIMYGPIGISPQILRKQGYEESGIFDDYEVLQDQTANWKRDEALALAEDWLTRYPELDGIICQNDDMALGALEAVEAAGKKDEILVVGIDAIEDALLAVKEGRLDCTVFQDAAGQGAAAVDSALKLIKGEKVEKEFLIPFQLVTKDNVDDFMK